MTTPDHRPYLTATNLRTPEDVLDAMDAYHPCEEAGDVAFELRVRLDRERRQACRRAALAEWRHISGLLRGKGLPFLAPGDEVPASIGILPFLTVGSHSPNGIRWGSANEVYRWIYNALTRALAFRAAAREP